MTPPSQFGRHQHRGNQNHPGGRENPQQHARDNRPQGNAKHAGGQDRAPPPSKGAPNAPRLARYVLAAYYSDARLNILACLNDVRLKTGLKAVGDEGETVSALASLKLTDTSPENQRARVRLLRQRFPFLNPMTDPNPGKPDAPQRKPDAELTDKERQQREKRAKERAEALHEPTPAEIESRLRWTLDLVHDLRNSLVHPNEPPAALTADVHKYLYLDLGKVYDAALRTVGTRFGLPPETREPLLRLAAPPRGQKGRKGKPRDKQPQQEKAKPKPFDRFNLALCLDPFDRSEATPPEATAVIHDFGLVLLCALFLEKSQSAELIRYFWDTGYAAPWSEQEQAVAKELIGVYRARLPMQRLQSDEGPQAVTLDTLAELSRCPMILFDALSEQDQRRFRTGATPGAPALAEPDTDDPAAAFLMTRRGDRFVPLTMRLLDLDPASRIRFAVDRGQYFYNVRWKPGTQFADGRGRVRRLGRKMVGYGRLRELLGADKPAAWQRLEQNFAASADAADAAEAGGYDAIQPLLPYIVPTEPHYHYNDDKIGIRLTQPNAVAAYPDLPSAAAAANTERCALDGAAMEPDFWLSPAQLLHLSFYAHLQRTDSKSLTPDVILRRYRGGFTKLLRQLDQGVPVLDGAPETPARRAAAQGWINQLFDVGRDDASPEAPLGELPKVVARALLGADASRDDAAAIAQRIGHLIEDTERRIKRLDGMLQGVKKRGKPGFEPIKAGPAAVFLTEDLLRFQPLDPNWRAGNAADDDEGDRGDTGGRTSPGGKINSQQYQILEAALAYYAVHIDEPPRIVELLRNAGLLEGATRHPFLHRLGLTARPDQFSGILAFYRAYLRERIAFLDEERRRLAQSSCTDPQPPRWLRLRQRSSLDTWLAGFRDAGGHLLEEPRALPVPANLFYRPTLVATARALGTTPDALLAEGSQQAERAGGTVTVRPALTWFLQRYLERDNDGPQAMYTLPRGHDLFDACLDTRAGRFGSKRTWHLDEEARRIKLEAIRAGQHRGPAWNPIDDDKLGKLYRDYRRRERDVRHLSTGDMALFLHGRSRLAEHMRPPAGASATVWGLRDINHTLLNTAADIELPVPGAMPARALRHPACKIRNLGELGLLARDKRLSSLLRYYPATEAAIDQAEIRAELASYRRTRVQIMQMLHVLEPAIVAVAGNLAPPEIPPEEQCIFGTGRHGKLLRQLREVWRADAGDPTVDAFVEANFRRALDLRNAVAHNTYPDIESFPEIAAAVAAEPLPDNPANPRHVARRLLGALERIYHPWLLFLGCTLPAGLRRD
jgi:hypothetical protein